jgi:1-acyl-sn-glycerol-3-phosphate acyltransferase
LQSPNPRIIKKVFAFFWTIYALLIFIIIGSVFFLVELVLISLGNLTYRAAHRWPAFCTQILLFLWGIQVRQHNKEILKNLHQCVIVVNHRSDLDALIATAYMPDIYKFIGKQELVNYPFIGRLVEKLYITVDRRSKNSRLQSLRNMKKQSNKGAHIVVFPEGWSNFSKEYLLELRKGAFKVALDLELPILVCTMIGTHELFPKPKISLLPGRVDVFWESIVDTKGFTFDEDAEVIQEKVRNIFLTRLQKYYPNGYTYPSDQVDFETWMKKN